jgi:hypothetical protein
MNFSSRWDISDPLLVTLKSVDNCVSIWISDCVNWELVQEISGSSSCNLRCERIRDNWLSVHIELEYK